MAAELNSSLKKLNILFIEPFYKGSHKYFADNLKKYSEHNITLSTRNGVFWKWKVMESELLNHLAEDHNYDIIMGSNMMNMAAWAGHNRRTLKNTKLAMYFHENQLTYPQSEHDKKAGGFFGYHNISSAMACDFVLFNSNFHKKNFIDATKRLSQKLPDRIPTDLIDELETKSRIVPIGIDAKRFEAQKQKVTVKNEKPLVLWNHRWEFDKNPELFLNTLIELSEKGHEFELAMLGSAPKKLLPIFEKSRVKLSKHIIQWGRVDSFEEYAALLWKADILPVTSNHDYFGISVLEAALCETELLLPERNAYPDHFEPTKFKDIYFETDAEFKEKFESYIVSFKERKYDSKLIEVPKKYNWDSVVSQFDLEVFGG